MQPLNPKKKAVQQDGMRGEGEEESLSGIQGFGVDSMEVFGRNLREKG